MDTRIDDKDVIFADELLTRLNKVRIIEKGSVNGDEQGKRVIAVLVEYGYIQENSTHILTTDKSQLYFTNGGAKNIYEHQRREQQMKEWQYYNAKWMNCRSWVAVVLSVLALLLELVEFLV